MYSWDSRIDTDTDDHSSDTSFTTDGTHTLNMEANQNYSHPLPPPYSESHDPPGYSPQRVAPILQPQTGQNQRSRRKKVCCWTVCTGIFILIVLAIVLPVLYCIQRSVTFNILPISANATTVEMDPNGFSVPIVPTVQATNNNFFDVLLTSVQASAYHPLYGNGNDPLGTGNVSNVNLPDRSTTQFTFPLTFIYSNAVDADYVYLQHLLQNCSDAANGQLYVAGKILIAYSVWAKSGTEEQDRNIYVPCPLDAAKARQLLSLVSGLP